MPPLLRSITRDNANIPTFSIDLSADSEFDAEQFDEQAAEIVYASEGRRFSLGSLKFIVLRGQDVHAPSELVCAGFVDFDTYKPNARTIHGNSVSLQQELALTDSDEYKYEVLAEQLEDYFRIR